MFNKIKREAKAFRKWWCNWQHTAHWERIKPGHRRCTKCGFNYIMGAATVYGNSQQKKLPK